MQMRDTEPSIAEITGIANIAVMEIRYTEHPSQKLQIIIANITGYLQQVSVNVL